MDNITIENAVIREVTVTRSSYTIVVSVVLDLNLGTVQFVRVATEQVFLFLLDITNTDELSQVRGKAVRVKMVNDTWLKTIGHIYKDVWFGEPLKSGTIMNGLPAI